MLGNGSYPVGKLAFTHGCRCLQWPEVFAVNSTSASQTIDMSRTVFATHALPITLVSENGPSFSSFTFKRAHGSQ